MKNHNEDNDHIRRQEDDEREAFHMLFTTHYPRVKGFIAAFVKSQAVGEDLAQDVFMRLWTHRETLPNIGSPGAYLYRSARNAAIDYLKSKSVRSAYDGDIPDDKYKSVIEEEYFAKEKELLVRMTVSVMPPQRKLVFEMSRFEDLTNDEIASRLGITKKSVENHMNLAIKDIKKVIILFVALYYGL